MSSKPKVKLKTIQYEYKGTKKHIFNDMTIISKNIFNCCVFTNNMFAIYKNKMYKYIYKLLLTKQINCNHDFFDLSKSILNEYYKIYSDNYQLIKTNNNIIYNYVKSYINNNNIILNNSNIEQFIIDIYKNVKKLVVYDKYNKYLVLTYLIDKIIKYFYNKNYYKVKNELINHKPLTIYDKELIDNVKQDKYYFEDTYENYKTKLKIEYDIELKSDQYLFKMFVYDFCLGNNKNKLPADVILNLIDKYYEAIKSYYSKIKLKMRANKPKFINHKFSLYYFPSSFKIENNKIRLNVGNYIGENYYNDLYKINHRKYCLHNNIQLKIDNKKKKQYIKIKDGYVNKKNVIDGNYVYINLLSKIKNNKIKLIQILPYGNKYLININYEEEYNCNITKEKMTVKNSISIDPGMKNLMTIYNPTGTQHIIKGGNIKTINEFYNKKISSLQSMNKDNNTFNRLYSLLYDRKNKINGEINRIINLLIKTYEDKKYIIFGYNESWKNNVNMGTKNNRMFYSIPYSRIINKLRYKLEELGKELIITEESYTSKCDSLNLEELCKHNLYDGIRKNRGLFISKIGKAINADLNGAINIMRKKIKMKEITGLNIFNPMILSCA